MPSPHPPTRPTDPIPAAPSATVEPDRASLMAPIVDGLAEAHVGADAATLVRLSLDEEGVSLASHPLVPGAHPADALLGMVVPSEWDAVGVAAPARAHQLGPGPPAHDPVEVGIAVVVDRSGGVLHRLGGPGAPSLGDPPVDSPTGALRDLLERSLGIPTRPPAEGPAAWWRRMWLDRLVREQADPASAPDRDVDGASDLVRALVDEPRHMEPGSWEQLRVLVARPADGLAPGPAAVRRSLTPFVDPSTAAWFDSGAFSRWLLAALPGDEELLDALAAVAGPRLAGTVRKALERRSPSP